MKRTIIKKSAIKADSIRRANNILGTHGKRLCKYTGELLDLNTRNFARSTDDQFGFQLISKLGKKLYQQGALEVKSSDRQYKQYDKKVVTNA